MLVTFLIIHSLLVIGVVDFPSFSFSKCRQLWLITLAYTANTAFALVSLSTLNVPMCGIFISLVSL